MSLLGIGLAVGVGYLGYQLISGDKEPKRSCAKAEIDAAYQTALYTLIRPSEVQAVADYIDKCPDQYTLMRDSLVNLAFALEKMTEPEWIAYAGPAILRSGRGKPGEVLEVRYKDTERTVTITLPTADVPAEPKACNAAELDVLNQAVIYTVYYPADAKEAAKAFGECGKTDYAVNAENKATALAIMGEAEWLALVSASLFYAGGKPGETVVVKNRKGEMVEVTVRDPSTVAA